MNHDPAHLRTKPSKCAHLGTKTNGTGFRQMLTYSYFDVLSFNASFKFNIESGIHVVNILYIIEWHYLSNITLMTEKSILTVPLQEADMLNLVSTLA